MYGLQMPSTGVLLGSPFKVLGINQYNYLYNGVQPYASHGAKALLCGLLV